MADSNVQEFKLPDFSENGYVLIAMRYKDRELGFAMKPERMDHELIPAIQALREAVINQADLIEENAK